METPELSTPMPEHRELEEDWRLKLEGTRHQYHIATTKYRQVLQAQPEGLPPSPDGAVGRARQAESDALAEYTRVLRIFTDLIIYGKIPDQQSAGTKEGV